MAELTDRFEPIPDKAYGTCSDCGMVLDDREASQAHMDETLRELSDPDRPSLRARSHSISISNGTRAERIQAFISDVEREAVDDGVDDILSAIDNGHLTKEEALAAFYRNDLVRDELEEALR